MTNQDHAQYAAAAVVPLIKSPSLRVPKPVEMPEDMYPLPPSISEYFAYPFTLEPHVITLESSRQTTIAAHAARREAYLKSREEDKARRKKEALHRVAPGFHPNSGPLIPRKMGGNASHPIDELAGKADAPPPPPRSVMDDLVDQLAALDAKR